MMDYGYWPMMGGGGFVGALALLTWLVWLVVGALLIIWLWKKINNQ